MNYSNYHQQIGATTACTKIMTEAIKGIGQRYVKGSTKDCFIFDNWFSSNQSSESGMELSDDLIGMIQPNKKLFCKETIDKHTKYWPGGS